MVAALGGPQDVLQAAGLAAAPVVVPVAAPHAGVVGLPDVRALGLVVVQLGGGRVRAGQAVDPRVGLSQLLPPGTRVARGDPLALVHAADAPAAAAAVQAVLQASHLSDQAPAPGPVRLGRVI
jgi:thymidine phosphorylase